MISDEISGYVVVTVNGREVRRKPAQFKTSARADGQLNITLYSDLEFDDVPPGNCELWASPSIRGPLQVRLSKNLLVPKSHKLVVNAKTDYDRKNTKKFFLN